jgi:RNA polymerase sigma factor for flagellar operon FliA
MAIRHYEDWKRYKLDNDSNARNKLIEEFVPLVHFVVGRASLQVPNMLDHDDLIAAGTLGLISAVGAFDFQRGIEFTTFAVPRIRGAVLDELRKHTWVPRTARERASRLEAAEQECRRSDGVPDVAQLARAMKTSRRRIRRMLASARRVAFVPLEHRGGAGDDGTAIADIIADGQSDDPGAKVELNEQCELLTEALRSLPRTQRDLLVDYYFNDRQQKDIAGELRVSRSRISQIHTEALLSLRRRMLALGAA